LLDHGDYLLKPFNNQSSTRNSTQIFVFICAVSIFVPLLFEPNAFVVRHNFQNISDEAIYGIISDEYPGEIVLPNFRDGAFESLLDQGAHPIIFGAMEEQNTAPISEDTGNDCEDKVMIEFHLALISILIGCIIGNYFGDLYSLRYRSNVKITCLYGAPAE
jgi:hypothetical protein